MIIACLLLICNILPSVLSTIPITAQTVYEEPVIMSITGDGTMKEGPSRQFKIGVSPWFGVKVTPTKNGRLIDLSEKDQKTGKDKYRYIMTPQLYVFTINATTPNDSGLYAFEFANDYGSSKAGVKLVVQEIFW